MGGKTVCPELVRDSKADEVLRRAAPVAKKAMTMVVTELHEIYQVICLLAKVRILFRISISPVH